LLALSPDRDVSKAGANSTHSKHFAEQFSAPAVEFVVVVSCHAPQQSLGKGWIKAMEKLGSDKRPGWVKPVQAKGKSQTRKAGIRRLPSGFSAQEPRRDLEETVTTALQES
jgi:methylmalonyl-CoA mutase cobalamin-binding subunit